jgi:hypothetical protein
MLYDLEIDKEHCHSLGELLNLSFINNSQKYSKKSKIRKNCMEN